MENGVQEINFWSELGISMNALLDSNKFTRIQALKKIDSYIKSSNEQAVLQLLQNISFRGQLQKIVSSDQADTCREVSCEIFRSSCAK
jgi:hypothetical protein